MTTTAPARTRQQKPHAARPASSSSARPELWLAAVLWTVAFSHRLFLLLGNVDRSWPFPVFYEGDAETFFNHAQAILRGLPYDGGIPFHPPVFPYFLAFWHGLLGDPVPHLALRVVLAGFHALSVPLLWMLVRRELGRAGALAAALLAAWSFGLSLVSIAAVSEGLYIVLLLASLFVFRGLVRGEGCVRRGAVLGLLLGLLSSTRAEGLGIAAILLGWGCLHALRRPRRRPEAPAPAPTLEGRAAEVGRRGARAHLRPWVAAAVLFGVALVPWTVRNALVLGRVNDDPAARGLEPLPELVVTTAYGPLNFALANHPDAPGYFTRTLLTSGLHAAVLDLRDPQHRAVFLHGYAHGWEYIRTRPAEFAELVARKWAITARVLRLGWTQWNLPGGLRGTRYPVDLFTPDSGAAVPVHVVLLAGGVVVLLRRHRRGGARKGERGGERGGNGGGEGRGEGGYLVLTALLVAHTLAVTGGFFGYARQGVIVLPLLFGVEGAALAAAAALIARRLPERLRAGSLGVPRAVWFVVAVVWMAGLAGAFQNRNYMAEGETRPDSPMLNRDSIMRLFPKND